MTPPAGRIAAALAGIASLALLWPGVAGAEVRAGVAKVDATWHVGASAGQYASGETPADTVSSPEGTFDPTVHAYRRTPSYGIQSRLSVRALVVEGPDGERFAILKNDLYIPQDLVYRRAGQLLEERGSCGIGPESLVMAVTHNHSSPFYSSSSWGAWAFQDVFDVRFFNYMAERMFQAVERACRNLVPARVGAAVGYFDKTHKHSFGPAIADDGTPAGYPWRDTDHDMTVVRFDDVSGRRPKPLANLVNFSLHPEFLSGNDLISADYLGPLERMTDRATGALTVFTQAATGSAEIERSTYHSIHRRLEFDHKEYAQAEYGARLMSDRVIDIWRDIARGSPDEPDRFVPFDSDFPVAMEDRWYPGPFSHPYPGVSSCRTDKGLAGDPQLPVVGLPDCTGVQDGLADLSDLLGLPEPPAFVPPIDPGLTTDDFQAAGIPVPENYSAPSYTGLQEDIDVHLQAIRLGSILITVCSCEQWHDQSENIETRTDKVTGNEYLGYDWAPRCRQNGDGTYEPDGSGTGTWSCPNPTDTTELLEPIGDHEFARMRAQVNNPANGWNDAENAASAESEPANPLEIKGNFTHDDRCGPDPLTPGNEPCEDGGVPVSESLGYRLTIPIGMANDYNGYIVSYREYQRGDHYRKALAGWGPHSSDYMATRLVTLGRLLKQPALTLPKDQRQEQLLAAKAEADTAVNDRRAQALGEVGGSAIAAFEAGLPDEAPPGVVEQPHDVERFAAAFFRWNGGSNFTDNPTVVVQRRVGGGGPGPGRWQRYADQSGELPVTLRFPAGTDTPSYLAGDQEWTWTAHFEAFVSPFDTGERPRATPQGIYRFRVRGTHREGGEEVPYRLKSKPFAVRAWSGIEVRGFSRRGARMSFRLGPRSRYTVGGPESEVNQYLVDQNGSHEVPSDFSSEDAPVLEAEIGPVDYPDGYESPARFIANVRTAYRDPQAPADPERLEWFCFTCSFRPWIDAGDARTARVRIYRRDGTVELARATRRGDGWVVDARLRRGDTALIAPGDVRDRYGNYNGEPAGPLSRSPRRGCGTPQVGGRGDDRLRGGSGRDLLIGLTGDDRLRARERRDCLFGAAGRDSLAAASGDDRLSAGRGSDVARGGDGADLISGGRGHDRLIGGAGEDRISGGRGSDVVRAQGRERDVVKCGGGRDLAVVTRVDVTRACERVRRAH